MKSYTTRHASLLTTRTNLDIFRYNLVYWNVPRGDSVVDMPDNYTQRNMDEDDFLSIWERTPAKQHLQLYIGSTGVEGANFTVGVRARDESVDRLYPGQTIPLLTADTFHNDRYRQERTELLIGDDKTKVNLGVIALTIMDGGDIAVVQNRALIGS